MPAFVPLSPVPNFGLSALRVAGALICAVMGSSVAAQQKSVGVAASALSQVTVTAKANRDPVEKSYRKMIRGMELFESQHGLSPNGSLRFKLLPRKRETDMNSIELEVLGSTIDFADPVAPDYTFTLARNSQALEEDAQVTPNRKAQSMTWRTEIRTPGLPPNTRRLGDLRLECEVGLEAGLVSNDRSIVGRIASAIADIGYCSRKDARYLFFADRPLFSVALISGQRKNILPVGKLYAAASDDPNLKEDLPFCDCEVLIDRTYFLPLGDSSWPDHTLVEFEYMEGD